MRIKCNECGAYGIDIDGEVELTCEHDDFRREYFCRSCQEFREPDRNNLCPRCEIDMSEAHVIPEDEDEVIPDMEPEAEEVIVTTEKAPYHKTEVDGDSYVAACGTYLEAFDVITIMDIEERRPCQLCYPEDDNE